MSGAFDARFAKWLRQRGQPKSVRAKYDAAGSHADNRNHWQNADALSSIAANTPSVRKTLRNRARYEIANNSIASGIIGTLANDAIGTGPKLAIDLDDDEACELIEDAFDAWASEICLGQKLRTMRQSRAQDGEAFGILTTNPMLMHPVKLDLRLVEAEQVATPGLSKETADAVDGIVFDKFGNPTKYHVLKTHPGGGDATTQYDAIDAAFVLHWMREDRPGQKRGIPEIMPALSLFAQLRRYTQATIGAAETAADFAAILYTDAPANEDGEIAEPWEEIALQTRTMMTVPAGYKAQQFKPEQPTTTYADFKNEIVKEIARCVHMPLNVASGDSSGYNYASGRLDHQTYHRAIWLVRDDAEKLLLRKILLAWMDEAALAGVLPQGLPPFAYIPVSWLWDGFEHVDPLKVASAQTIRLNNRTATMAEEMASNGVKWRQHMKQLARESSYMASLGLTRATDTATPPAEAVTETEEDDSNAQ